MKEFNYTITDPQGIHARPAGELVKAAKVFTSSIKMIKDGKEGDCKKIFTIMGLSVKTASRGCIYEDILRKKRFWRGGSWYDKTVQEGRAEDKT